MQARPHGLLVIAGLLALCLLVGCGSGGTAVDGIAADPVAPVSSASTSEPVHADILAAARTPVAYDAQDGPRPTALNSDAARLHLIDRGPAGSDPARDGNDGSNGGGLDDAMTTFLGQAADALTGSGGSVQRSVSRMGLITMRKIVVPESTTRRVVPDRDRERRESPSDKRGGQGPTPSPSPARRLR